MKSATAHLGAHCPDLPALLDGLPVGVAWLDEQGRILMLNRALEALTGFNREEVRGLPCRHVLRSRACVQSCPHRQGDGESASGVETDCINRHRRKIPVRITPVRLASDGGGPCIFDVVEDLTPLREAEARLSQAAGPGQVIGRSPAMEKILRLVPAVAQGESPVLITGETGTGKDILAEMVHKASNRSREPFVRFSCGPMPAEQLEAELFGRVDEAGQASRPGRFQQAQGGTLYLSEIADLPLAQQAGLVRYLDEGVILPLGAQKPIRANVRIMASTAALPEKLVKDGRLRDDLLHRLAAIRLHLPRLKDRGEDVGFLLHHFLGVYAARFKKNIGGIAPKALRLLSAYAYPGNVRELKNIMEYAVMVASGDTIQPSHLPGHLPGVAEAPQPAARPAQPRKTGRRGA